MREGRFRKQRSLRVRAVDYTNPYYPTRSPEQRRSRRRLIIVGGVAAGIIGLAFVVFATPIFSVGTITVEGTQALHTDDVTAPVEDFLHERALGLFSKSNLLFFRASDLTRRLSDAVGSVHALDWIRVSRPTFRTVKVTLQETNPELVWTVGDETFYTLDASGIITEKVRDIETIDVTYPVIEDLNALDVEVGEQVVGENVTSLVLNAFQQWDDGLSGFPVLYAEVPVLECSQPEPVVEEETPTDEESSTNEETASTNFNTNDEVSQNVNSTNGNAEVEGDAVQKPECPRPLPLYEIQFVTEEGFRVLMTTERSLDEQFSEARYVINDRLDGDTSRLSYVDTRFAGRLYYQ